MGKLVRSQKEQLAPPHCPSYLLDSTVPHLYSKVNELAKHLGSDRVCAEAAWHLAGPTNTALEDEEGESTGALQMDLAFPNCGGPGWHQQ